MLPLLRTALRQMLSYSYTRGTHAASAPIAPLAATFSAATVKG